MQYITHAVLITYESRLYIMKCIFEYKMTYISKYIVTYFSIYEKSKFIIFIVVPRVL